MANNYGSSLQEKVLIENYAPAILVEYYDLLDLEHIQTE